MSETTSLTGTWTGHYFQHDLASPIEATLVQDGEKLTGSMGDGRTETDSSLFDFAANAGLPPGADEQIEAQLRAMFPDAPAGPIRYVTLLPTGSVLEGWARGTRVYLLKTYEGGHFTGYKMGDFLIGDHIEAHSVHYGGTLSPDGRAIEGKWWIDPPPGGGGKRAEGSFELRRAAD